MIGDPNIFANLPLPACLLQGKVLISINGAFTALTGYAAVGLGTPSWEQIVHADDHSLLPGLFNGQGASGVDARLMAKDGRVLRVRMFATTLEAEKFSLIQVVDIPEVGRLEQEAAHTRADYEDLLANTSDIVVIHSLDDDRILRTNPAFSLLSGYPAEEWLGRPMRDLVAPRFAHRYDDHLQNLIQTGRHQGIMSLLDAQGRERYLEFHDQVHHDGPNAVVRGIAHEVTNLVTHSKDLEQMLDGITLAMADLVEQRDPYTSGHQTRVAEIAVTIGQQMGWSPKRLRALFIAASLHDIGKISIPAEILSKPALLSHLERKLIEEHPRAGADILRRVPFPRNVTGIILSHHERLDGSGYPRGLKGDEIDLESRVLAVADVYEAMTTHRPYRPALSTEAALTELQGKSGILYDKEVVRILVDMIA